MFKTIKTYLNFYLIIFYEMFGTTRLDYLGQVSTELYFKVLFKWLNIRFQIIFWFRFFSNINSFRFSSFLLSSLTLIFFFFISGGLYKFGHFDRCDLCLFDSRKAIFWYITVVSWWMFVRSVLAIYVTLAVIFLPALLDEHSLIKFLMKFVVWSWPIIVLHLS